MPRELLASIEHRWGRRFPCCARLRLEAPGIDTSARFRDLSMSGAFIETNAELTPNTPVTIAILREDGSQREQRLRATVVRRTAEGLGVEWWDTPAGPVCPALGCASPCPAARF